MPIVSYREVASRFSHIDGTVRSAECSFEGEEEKLALSLVLRFYPWWEHPLYLAAVQNNSTWGFQYEDDASQDVRIRALDPVLCNLQPNLTATDLRFSVSHSCLWEFEDQAELFCNSSFEPRQLLDRILARKDPDIDLRTLLQYLPPYPTYRAPYSLGYLPRRLFGIVREVLSSMQVSLFVAREPVERPALVALLLDEHVVSVARDFLVEVPEFVHDPDWFQPAEAARTVT